MLNSQNLINKICACITGGGLTALQTCQLNGALTILCQPVCSVLSFANLPDATTYAGRMIYVNDENRYYHAMEGAWITNFQSTIFNYADQIWSWGCGQLGRLGDNTTTNRSSPVSVVGNRIDWCQVSAGAFHNLALTLTGAAWSWGSNTTGLLGDGTTSPRSSPVSVTGCIVSWCQVGAGRTHSMAISDTGTLWGWGCNTTGQLGSDNTTNTCSPVSVVGGITTWCQVSAGCVHTLSVRRDGSVWAWGDNSVGQLGINTTTNRSSPVSVLGGFTDWCQASAGASHSVAVRLNGTTWSWGCGQYGRLGENNSVNRSSPVNVTGGFTNWCASSAGAAHSVGIRTDGTIWSWGRNNTAQLGDNSITDKSSPVSVVGGFTDWCTMSAGESHTLGSRSRGSAWAWGTNDTGRLGDGTISTRSSPVSVLGGFTDWCAVSAGFAHSVAIRQACKGC